MSKNKLIFSALIIGMLILFTISDVTALDDSNSLISDSGNDFVSNNNVLSSNDNDGSFSDLNNLIINDYSGQINLDKNYNSKDSNDSLIIAKENLVINGNNFTLKSNEAPIDMKIFGSNIEIRNININNLMIHCYGSNISLINSNFNHCFIDLGDNSSIINSTIINGIENTNQGGVIDIYGNNVVFRNNILYNNSGKIGSVSLSGNNITLINNTIFNDSAVMGGGIYIYGKNNKLINNKILNNTADYGGGVFIQGKNATLINNIIAGNIAKKDIGGIAYSEDLNLVNNTVQNNTPTNSEIRDVKDSNLTYINDYDVLLDDGYYIYCTSHYKWGAGSLSIYFNDNSSGHVLNNLDNSDVAQYLKILIYNYADLANQDIVWIFTDEDYLNSNNTVVQNVISDYNKGLRLSDNPVKQLNETHYMQYFFKFYYPTYDLYQNLMGYKISSGDIVYNLTASKISLNSEVLVGGKSSFLIKLTNTGNWKIDYPFIKELEYDGLVYDSYVDEDNIWIYDNHGIWTFNGSLNPNETIYLKVVFNTTRVGNFTNFAVVGSNNTDNKSVNNTTTVFNHTKENNTNNSSDVNKTNSFVSNVSKEMDVNKDTMYNAGNPLFALFMVLILGFVSLRRKK